jgi:hypothetical protein
MLAITLLLAFAFPFALPLIAATADPEASLPSCCRMHGAHTCSMTRTPGTAALPAFRASPCPLYPNTLKFLRITPATVGISLPLSAQPTYTAAQVIFRPSPARIPTPAANLKRGPPALLA